MRDIQVTQSGQGKSAWIPLDKYIAPQDVGLFTKVTGVALYTIEATEEDPFQSGGVPSDATANIYPLPDLEMEAENRRAKLDIPARCLRINQLSGAGSVRLTIVQTGIGGL